MRVAFGTGWLQSSSYSVAFTQCSLLDLTGIAEFRDVENVHSAAIVAHRDARVVQS